MHILLWFLLVYVIGGVTLIPLVIYLLFYFAKTKPEPHDDSSTNGKGDGLFDGLDDDESISNHLINASNDEDLLDASPEKIRNVQEGDIGVDAYATCWVTVSRDYFVYPAGDSKNTANPPHSSMNDASLSQNESAYSNLYKLMSNSSSTHHRQTSKDQINAPSSPTSSSSPATLSRSSTAQSTNSASSPSSVGKKSLSKLNKYFAVLKHGNILLYLDSDQVKLKHVIVLANHVVSLWPKNVPDGELFLKRSAICLARKDSPDGFDMLLAQSSDVAPTNAFYLYTDSCTEKEDFYFALIRASKQSSSFLTRECNPLIMAVPYQYKTSEIMDLMLRLHSNDANLQSRWLNGLLGRLFLSLKGTGKLEAILEQKAQKKLARVKRPGYLGEFEVKKLHIGDSIPMFTNLKLKDLTAEGQLIIEADVSYSGGLSVEIATKAILNLGSKFKARDVSLVLAVTLKNLEGRMQFLVKPPPSNRVWYAFESMPKMNLVIEPIVSSKQITYSMVTKTIENRIKDAFRETLVIPNYDDLCFSSTEDEFYRGGIWDKEVQVMDLPISGSASPIPHPPDSTSNGFKADSGGFDDSASIMTTDTSFSAGDSKSLGTKSSSLLKKTKTTILSMSTSSSSDASSRKNGHLRRRTSVGSIKTTSALEDNDAGAGVGADVDADLISPTVSSTGDGQPKPSDFDISAHIGELKSNSSNSASEPKSPTSPQKKDLVGAVKKWGSWYFKDKITKVETALHERNGSERLKTSYDSSDYEDELDVETSKGPLAAPLPHNFPPEIMQLLNEEENQAGHQHGLRSMNDGPYNRIPEMQVPSSLKRAKTVARKPVGSGVSDSQHVRAATDNPTSEISTVVADSNAYTTYSSPSKSVETVTSADSTAPYSDGKAAADTSKSPNDEGTIGTENGGGEKADDLGNGDSFDGLDTTSPVPIPMRQRQSYGDVKPPSIASSFDIRSNSTMDSTSSSAESNRSSRRMSNVSLPSGIKDQGIFVLPTAAEPVVSSSEAINVAKQSPRHSKKHRVPRKKVPSTPDGPYLSSGIVSISQESLHDAETPTVPELEQVDPLNSMLEDKSD